MNDNLAYEFFIRRIWSCERFSHGANTDTWERLTVDFFNYKNPQPGAKVNQLERTYEKKLKEVKGHLDKAFNKLGLILGKKKNIPPQVLSDVTDRRMQVAKSTEPQEILDCLTDTIPILDQYDIRLK